MEHPDFKRTGDDLNADLNVDIYTMLLGGKVSYKSLKGNVKIDIPKETQNGKVLRLQKLGMPKYGKTDEYGNLYLKINVLLPTKLSAKEIELFKELQNLKKK